MGMFSIDRTAKLRKTTTLARLGFAPLALGMALALVLVLALMTTLALLPSQALCGPKKPAVSARQQVLLVHSYHKEYPWSRQVTKGVEQALKGTGVSIATFYMDAKRQSSPAQLAEKAQEALKLIEKTQPLVVIASDDAAQEYLVAPHLKGRDRPQVVFCGVNAPVEKYGYPAPNVSGVREHMHVREALALLKQIDPNIKTASFITDASETSGYVVEDMRDDLRQGGPFALQLKSVDMVSTVQQWQKMVQRNQSRTNALMLALYHTLKDERTGQVATPEEVMAWTRTAAKVPTMGLVDFAADHGVLCGVLESGHEQGYLAGGMAREVLKGVPVGNLPVRVNKRGLVFINLQTAKRLGIAVPYPLIEAAGILVK